MLIEITLKSRFKLVNTELTFKQLSIVNPLAILANFEKNNRLVLGPDAMEVVNGFKPKIKSKLLAINAFRREMDEFKKSREQYSCSSNINQNNYNNRYAREYVNRQLLFGI